MDDFLFKDNLVTSNRILYTPSTFAKSNLIHLQETGNLKSLKSHTSQRTKLKSYLFFIVLSGSGSLTYEGATQPIKSGQCVFIDCQKPYAHSCNSNDLWQLSWVHFYGPNMDAMYNHFINRGGRFIFTARNVKFYQNLLSELFEIANIADQVRDMKLYGKLVELLTCLYNEDRSTYSKENKSSSFIKLGTIKEYLDENYVQSISLDHLSEKFFINKYYLTRIFKEKYGTSINHYIIYRRITKAKELLRFSDKNVDEISRICGIDDPAYFSRLFKKVENVTPLGYRNLWSKP